jgi:hypothetical protein
MAHGSVKAKKLTTNTIGNFGLELRASIEGDASHAPPWCVVRSVRSPDIVNRLTESRTRKLTRRDLGR